MKLDTEFIKLPLGFDVERLREEVLAFDESVWRPHPQGHPGNSALQFIALGGDPNDDGVAGAMLPTPHLAQCEYVQQVLASFGTVIGRSRLMRLDGGGEATMHVDTNYYWAERVRIHVPIVTSPEIEFICEDQSLHMAAGEAWIFDAWRRHNVLNPTDARRIHLVADTVGSDAFWKLVEAGEWPFAEHDHKPAETRHVAYQPGAKVRLELERLNYPVVMAPWEQEKLGRWLIEDLEPPTNGAGDHQMLTGALEALFHDWRAAWARYGQDRDGWQIYQQRIQAFDNAIAPLAGKLRLHNGSDSVEIARQMIVRPAINPTLANGNASAGGAAGAPAGAPAAAPAAAPQQPARPRVQAQRSAPQRQPYRFQRPIIIVSPPRSGSSLLFETLARSPSVWTVGGESHQVIESLPGLQPKNRGWDSNRLTPTDAQQQAAVRLRQAFVEQLRDRDGNPPADDATGLRMLEKTPKNSVRVPFLNSVFPDALFVYLYRDPRESLASMIEAWNSGRFVTYPDLPDWEGPPWSMVLTPEWRQLRGKPLAEVVAGQWGMATRLLLSDLEKLPPQRWTTVDYANFVEDPQRELDRLCEFAGIDWDVELESPLPLSRHTVTPPDPEKWKAHEAELETVLPATEELAQKARDYVANPPVARSNGQTAAAAGTANSPLRSVNTSNVPEILNQLGSSLLVSTYQTGKLIAIRRAGNGLNTHFRNLDSPMGIARDQTRVAVGTRSQVIEYQNLPQVCEKLEPTVEPYDGCYIPRRTHVTGDVRIHDVAYAGDELWMVATRFSCLATLDDDHSFVPRWRPKFISKLAAEDRCHLNGLAVVDDQVKYVTALGETDEAGAWRENKASGGVLIDIESDETIASGLSMPHSPRWYRDKLWLLESGEGSLATVDLDTGKVETVVELPGFTRGLAFAGPIAFIGLSQVREATTFGGLPLTGRLEERQCGIWIVNIETGQTLGFLRFEDLVQEIFDVAVLPGLRFPEIAELGSDAASLAYVVPDEALASAG
jgi:uncharacterized protein (TIGR03032 family)